MEHNNGEYNSYVHNQVIIGICVVLTYVCRRVPSLGHRFLPEKQLSLILFSFFLMEYEQMLCSRKKKIFSYNLQVT